MRFIGAQSVPMLVLGLAYLSAQHQINRVYVGGVSLDRLLLTSAVIAPLLSQSVSGPLFRSLEVAPTRDFRVTAELTLRNLPRALLVAAPILLGMCSLTGMVLGMDERAAMALVGVAWLHLVFAASMVPAYAHRRGALLVLGWSCYAATLALVPHLWWAPAVVGATSQLVFMLSVARTPAAQVPLASVRSMRAGLGRGIALAIPLWCLPVAIYLGTDGRFSPFDIFLSLSPAVLAYQVYFVLIATPVWIRLDRARELLSQQPYPTARAELRAISKKVQSGFLQTTGLVGVLLLVASAVVAAGSHRGAWVLLEISATASLSVLVIAEVTRLMMVRDGITPFVVSAVVCIPISVASLASFDTWVVLAVHSATCAACLAGTAVVNRRVWRTPEYSLFWVKALAA